MDPKSVQQRLRDALAAEVGAQNLHALAHYARLLKACGVRRVQVQRVIL